MSQDMTAADTEFLAPTRYTLSVGWISKSFFFLQNTPFRQCLQVRKSHICYWDESEVLTHLWAVCETSTLEDLGLGVECSFYAEEETLDQMQESGVSSWLFQIVSVIQSKWNKCLLSINFLIGK